MDERSAVGERFEDAYARLFGGAYQGAFRILGDRVEAEDIAQEALARCLARWKQSGGYADAFVTRVAVNLAIDRHRRLVRERTSAPERHTSSHDAQVELRADLVRALRTLSSRQRDVVVLRYFFDLPQSDVARAVGCSEGSVKRHASRGLARLRAEMGGTRTDPPDEALPSPAQPPPVRSPATDPVPPPSVPPTQGAPHVRDA